MLPCAEPPRISVRMRDGIEVGVGVDIYVRRGSTVIL